jgi:hypothetical protein
MVETNIRLIGHGVRLYLDVRRVRVYTSDNAPDLRERACSLLRTRHGLAAVPTVVNGEPQLLVVAHSPLGELVLEGPDWRVELRDTGTTQLQAAKPADALLMARLFERYLQVQLKKRTNMWTLDRPRIWYEAEPFQVQDGVAAVRRFHVSVVPVEGEGLGIVTHVSTAFFTVDTVADFFDESLPTAELRQRQLRFERLGQRHQAKGTLLYDLRHSQHKCYFENFLPGETCATFVPPPIDGVVYQSLYDYYAQKHPGAGVAAGDPVARVSFPSMERPCYVAATRLRLRVMNAALPGALKQIDKITPGERARWIDRFWAVLGEDLLGKGLQSGLWQPTEDKIAYLEPPTLLFGQGVELPVPSQKATGRTHFQRRFQHSERLAVTSYLPQWRDGS